VRPPLGDEPFKKILRAQNFDRFPLLSPSDEPIRFRGNIKTFCFGPESIRFEEGGCGCER
jgi:hypothetical protein